MDFFEIISVDLKELHPQYRKEGYKYILYIVDEFAKFMKGVLIRTKNLILIIYINAYIRTLYRKGLPTIMVCLSDRIKGQRSRNSGNSSVHALGHRNKRCRFWCIR